MLGDSPISLNAFAYSIASKFMLKILWKGRGAYRYTGQIYQNKRDLCTTGIDIT